METNERVDAQMVIEAAMIDAARDGRTEVAIRLVEARAAVAELIAAGWDALEELHRVSPSRASPRLRAALARITPAAQESEP